MSGNSEPIRLAFEFEKATKNTFKYAECPDPGQPPRIGTLYVQKWALKTESPPRTITLTIEVGGDTRKERGSE
jgi:hypothetical protein